MQAVADSEPASERPPLTTSVADAARDLNVTPATIYNWMHEGRIRSSKVGGRRLIPTSEVRRLAGADQ